MLRPIVITWPRQYTRGCGTTNNHLYLPFHHHLPTSQKQMPSSFACAEYVLQPRIPSDSFPITVGVFVGKSSRPELPNTGRRSGDLYLGTDELWIIQSGAWVKWNPSEAVLLEFDGDELYTTPCTIQGLRLVDDEEEHKSTLPQLRRDMGIGPTDDMTLPVLQRIKDTIGYVDADAHVTEAKVCER
jgi:hypothetical protein